MHRWIRIGIAMIALVSCRGTEPDALRLETAVDRTSLTRSDSAVLSMRLINQSNRTVSAYAPDSYGICSHAFQVFDAQNREVNIMTALCALSSLVAPTLIELAPGASVSIRDVWYPAQSSIDGHDIPVGTYRIVGRVAGDQRQVLGSSIAVSVFGFQAALP